MKNKSIAFLSGIFVFISAAAMMPADDKDNLLTSLLGKMPERSPLRIDTLENVETAGGVRYKIRYFIEPGNPVLETPDDWGYAYLFVPTLPKGKKAPAIVAMHQDDIYFHIGKSEPAGLAGDSTMFYGKELFERGYIVICPDRFYHADRRSTCQNWGDISEVDYERDQFSSEKRIGVLLAEGRNRWGKEAYDFSRAVDILESMPEVDTDNIGAIGHSAGANILSYGMYYDSRVKAAVANCGISEVNDYYSFTRPGAMNSSCVIPNSVKYGIDTHDYVAAVAPRALFISQGAHQWGNGSPDPSDAKFAGHLALFEKSYLQNGGKNITTVLFEENGGRHCFPPGIKEQAYLWLDKYLKK